MRGARAILALVMLITAGGGTVGLLAESAVDVRGVDFSFFAVETVQGLTSSGSVDYWNGELDGRDGVPALRLSAPLVGAGAVLMLLAAILLIVLPHRARGISVVLGVLGAMAMVGGAAAVAFGAHALAGRGFSANSLEAGTWWASGSALAGLAGAVALAALDAPRPTGPREAHDGVDVDPVVVDAPPQQVREPARASPVERPVQDPRPRRASATWAGPAALAITGSAVAVLLTLWVSILPIFSATWFRDGQGGRAMYHAFYSHTASGIDGPLHGDLLIHVGSAMAAVGAAAALVGSVAWVAYRLGHLRGAGRAGFVSAWAGSMLAAAGLATVTMGALVLRNELRSDRLEIGFVLATVGAAVFLVAWLQWWLRDRAGFEAALRPTAPQT